MTDSVAEWPARPRKVPNIFTTWLAIPAIIATLGISFLGPPILGLFIVVALLAPQYLLFVLVPAAVVAAIIYPFVRFVIKRRKKLFMEIQAERDAFAVEVAGILERGESPPPYSLYLRPFFTDGYLTADEGAARLLAIDPTELAEVGQVRDTERAMANALEEHAPLVSLGRPSDRFGAGRIETDDANWKALFEKLIAHAERVIMVPIGQPATMEEVRTIAATPELLEKTVFVRPANRKSKSFNFTPDESVKTIAGMWEWTRGELAEVLPRFPAFGSAPRLITFDEEGTPSEYRGNGMASPQLPSGLRTFMTEGRSAIADRWLVPALLFVAFLVVIPYWAVPIGYYIDLASLRSADLTPFDAQRAAYLFELMGMWSLVLVIYKFVTGDIPTRFIWPGVLLSFTFLATSSAYTYFFDATMDLYDPYATNTVASEEELWLFEAGTIALEVAIIWKVAIFGWLSAAVITGNPLRWQHIAIALGTHAAISFVAHTFAASASGGALIWVALVLPLLLAPILPIYARATIGQVVLCVVALLLCYGASALVMYAASDTLQAATSMTYGLDKGIWSIVLVLAPAALPLIGYGYIARMITGQGQARQWAHALPRYEG